MDAWVEAQVLSLWINVKYAIFLAVVPKAVLESRHQHHLFSEENLKHYINFC